MELLQAQVVSRLVVVAPKGLDWDWFEENFTGSRRIYDEGWDELHVPRSSVMEAEPELAQTDICQQLRSMFEAHPDYSRLFLVWA